MYADVQSIKLIFEMDEIVPEHNNNSIDHVNDTNLTHLCAITICRLYINRITGQSSVDRDNNSPIRFDQERVFNTVCSLKASETDRKNR